MEKIVSSAILDDAKVDEGQLRVEALRDLEDPHLRALERRLYRAEKQVSRLRQGTVRGNQGPVLAGRSRCLVSRTDPGAGRAHRDWVDQPPTPDQFVVYSGPNGINDFGRSLLDELRV